ncbi:unnamed protein product [Cylindrotheca closterium]|uniref:Uncharacterized protein n=1 Tax=Cylindrotheca closterium TaxID=2856 RepID=A0AAD2CRJ9_9STRA|nr:unnamed protein product [Cylindrotheca closterium]
MCLRSPLVGGNKALEFLKGRMLVAEVAFSAEVAIVGLAAPEFFSTSSKSSRQLDAVDGYFHTLVPMWIVISMWPITPVAMVSLIAVAVDLVLKPTFCRSLCSRQSSLMKRAFTAWSSKVLPKQFL